MTYCHFINIASSVQNEFETSVSYKNDEDTGNGTDGSDEGNWTCEEEPLKGTDGSRIAAYHPSKATWRCYECGKFRNAELLITCI